MRRLRLGVNIDHVATLREVRKATYPSVLEAARHSKKGGADQITVHLREDRRHIQDHDVEILLRKQKLPVNLEMAWVPSMVKRAWRCKPYSVTLVPERREEMTTEQGLNLERLRNAEGKLRQLKKRMLIYAFIDPVVEQVQWAKRLGFHGVEFHTGEYAEVFDKSKRRRQRELKRLREACRLAVNLGLEVKAGHGLTLENVRPIARLPGMSELNIGHFLVARAIAVGLEKAVREMKRAMT